MASPEETFGGPPGRHAGPLPRLPGAALQATGGGGAMAANRARTARVGRRLARPQRSASGGGNRPPPWTGVRREQRHHLG
eukprot:5528478-Pleurochrysis_carterae.AAC.1